MTDNHIPVFVDAGRPNRAKAAVIGMIGGLAGAYALRLYSRRVAPAIFPYQADPASYDINPVHSISLAGRRYQTGESAPAALGRAGYTWLAGEAPDIKTRERLEDVMPVALGVLAGALYGAARATTRAHDLAGGLFYGLRLWFQDTVGAALFGLRPGPRAYSGQQHAWRLAGLWVYSFTTTAVTRILYRLL